MPLATLVPGPRRFRVPDVLVTTRKIRGNILREAPIGSLTTANPELTIQLSDIFASVDNCAERE